MPKAIVPLASLLLASSAFAQPQPVAGPAGKVTWLYLDLAGLRGDTSQPLMLMLQGGRIERAIVPPLGMGVVDASGLKLEGDRLTCRMVIGHERIHANHSLPTLAQRMPLELDLTLSGNSVTGSFHGQWPVGKVPKPTDVKGTVTGTALDEAAMRQRFGLAEGANWPSYVGPNQNFSSGPVAMPLVDDFNQAKLLWASAYIGPPESGSKRYGACAGMPPAAGGASPVVVNGKVYQFRYQASGEVYDAHLDAMMSGNKAAENKAKMEAVGWTMKEMQQRWAIDADEQLVCIDAVTGKTLWSVTWPGEGINLLDHKCSLTNHTGVFADEKMFVLGALGIVRCVDGPSGKVLWSTDVPGLSAFMKDFKAKALKNRSLSAPTRSFAHALNISGKTILAPDGIGPCGIVGLDADTGKVLWRTSAKVLGNGATPLAWKKDDKDYVIAANAEGQITLLDAVSGKVMWQYSEAGNNAWTPLLVGDLLIARKFRGEDLKKLLPPKNDNHKEEGVYSAPGDNYGQVACWTLSPEKLEQLWAAPVEWGAPADGPVGSAAEGLICFRGKYSYYIVKPETGQRIASSFLSVPARFDEGHLLALPGLFVAHPDTQHGQSKLFPFPAKEGAKVGPVWMPPHPWATTYQVAMSHAWADGRVFIRGQDAIYCYDLRRARVD